MDHRKLFYLVIVLLLSGQELVSQDFNQWFDEGVLRLDLIISGNSSETEYALSGLKKEPYFSGSRSNLVDEFDYGDHMFEVRDHATDQLIYRYTYCTLYREWQTTAEADTLERAFSQVIRFPWPRRTVDVLIFDRDRRGCFEKKWSSIIDPGNMFIDQSIKYDFRIDDLEIHGDPSDKVDLLFVAEGYTREEMPKFIEDAKRSAAYIFSEEPFKSYRDHFNIRAIRSISQDRGTDNPGTGTWKNTILNSSFFTFGSERYMTTLDAGAIYDVVAGAYYDQIYILVNTDKYGGGGIYNFYSISAADNEQSRAVVIHEFGHTFAGLGDEYYNSSVAYVDYFPLDVEPWNPNLTTLVNFESKWEDMLENNMPVPTPAIPENESRVGVYEGGGYVAKGVYRPMIDCRMHSNDAVFCPVCSRAIINMIQSYSTE